MKNKNMQVLHSSPKTRRTPPAAGFATGLCFYKLFWIFLVGRDWLSGGNALVLSERGLF